MRKKQEAAGAGPVNPRDHALRLVFQYEGRDVKLVSVQRVRMMAPPPQAAFPRVGERGSWLELRDKAGQPLYRRVIDNPIRLDIEVVADEAERPLQRVRVPHPEGTFHLVVPEIAAARSLALRSERAVHGAASKEAGAAAAAADVLEFQLTERIKEAEVGIADGTVIGPTKIIDNGDPAERFNLVLVAEGYRESELDQFADDASHFASGLFVTDPFTEHRCAINIWRLDVASDESGANDPAGACGGTGATPRTYFDARFCNNGVPRALVCDSGLVLSTVAAHVPQFHSAQVIVNSSKYGGTGGQVGVSSTATQNSQGKPVDWREILIHEMGHSIFGLADEYWYYQGCDVNEPEQDNYTGGEPYQPNITKSPTAASKWTDLINTATLPTWENPTCSDCPPDPGAPGGPPNNHVVVGTFEGAYYHHCGAYRPEANCKMRKLGEPFCDVCRREIDEYLLPFDPSVCLTKDMLDLGKWAAVATILFGVIQDGGGLIIVGGKPIPIDPWGPLRHSLWGNLATPHTAPPAMRDALVGIALTQLASLVANPESRKRIETAAGALVEKAVAQLPAATIR